YLAERLERAGLPMRFANQPFFNELLVKLDRPVAQVLAAAGDAGVIAGYALGQDYPELSDCLLIAVTEKRTRAELDRLVEILTGHAAPKAAAPATPKHETGHEAAQFVTHDL